MFKKIAFLDRDGVLNVDTGYVYKKKDFIWIPGAKEAIALLKENNYKVLIITNQSGIGKKLFKYSDVDKLHKWINSQVNDQIDGFYICPHTPEDDCACRKPRIGLFMKAIFEHGPISNFSSFVIGDKDTDLLAAQKIGVKGYKFTGNNLLEFITKNII